MLEASRGLVTQVVEEERDTEAFTPAERARIVTALDEIREAVGRLELGAADTKRVLRVVDYVQKSSERLGRKDWFLLAVTLFTWAIPPDKAASLRRLSSTPCSGWFTSSRS